MNAKIGAIPSFSSIKRGEEGLFWARDFGVLGLLLHLFFKVLGFGGFGALPLSHTHSLSLLSTSWSTDTKGRMTYSLSRPTKGIMVGDIDLVDLLIVRVMSLGVVSLVSTLFLLKRFWLWVS